LKRKEKTTFDCSHQKQGIPATVPEPAGQPAGAPAQAQAQPQAQQQHIPAETAETTEAYGEGELEGGLFVLLPFFPLFSSLLKLVFSPCISRGHP